MRSDGQHDRSSAPTTESRLEQPGSNFGDGKIAAAAAMAESIVMRSLRGLMPRKAPEGAGVKRDAVGAAVGRVWRAHPSLLATAWPRLPDAHLAGPYVHDPRAPLQQPASDRKLECLRRLRLVTRFPAWQGDVRPSDERSERLRSTSRRPAARQLMTILLDRHS